MWVAYLAVILWLGLGARDFCLDQLLKLMELVRHRDDILVQRHAEVLPGGILV